MKPLTLLATAALCVSSVFATAQVPQNVKPLKVKNSANIEQMKGKAPVQQVKPMRIQAETAIPDDAVEMYAFQVFGYGWITSGFVTFPSYMPAERTFLYDYGYYDGANTFRSGTFVEDTYYAFVANSYAGGAFLEPVCLATVDLETGDWTSVADYSQTVPWNELFYEMSYDPKTELIYAIQTEYDDTGYATNRTKIWTIDPFNEADLQPKLVATIDHYLWTMSVDNGVIWGIEQEYGEEVDEYGYPIPTSIHLLSIDTETIANGTATVVKGATINGGNTVIDWSQTMEFDHTTHNLWWAGQPTGNGSGWLCKINTTDGSISERITLPEQSQYVALGIPYQTAADNAPSFVTGYTVTTGAEGKLETTLTWTNPTTTYAREELTQLSGVKVYRNESLIADITTVEAGAAQTYVDNKVRTGLNTYKIVPYNNEGDGIYKEREIYVGVDIPAAVSNATLTAEGSTATITWTAPTVGTNGGYIDVDEITYDVVRFPDNVTVATDLTATTTTDVVTEYKGYYYQIFAKDGNGQGSYANTNTMPFGPGLGMPYTNKFGTADEFNKLLIIDNNQDGNTWTYAEFTTSAGYFYCENAADDYMVTPPLAVVEGNEYEIEFDSKHSNWTGCIESLKVLAGYSSSIEELNIEILDLPTLEPGYGGVWTTRTARFTAPETGNIHIALYIYSAADMGSLDISNIKVRHISNIDLAAIKVFGSDIAYVNNPIKHRVDVSNTGNGTVSNAVVRLIDDNTGNTLGQATIAEIASGETTTVEIEWTPTSEGDITLSAVVEVDGDTFLDDNKTPKSLTVKVYKEDGEKWFSIGTANEVGWRPIFLGQNYSDVQTLYYSRDILVEPTYFTGLQYTYDYPSDIAGLDGVPLKIYMMSTELEELTEMLTIGEEYLVFDGTVDLAQRETVNYMNVTFDRAFKYEGKNIIIRVICNKAQALPNISWHIINELDMGLPCRSYCAFGDNATEAFESAYDNYYIPFVRLSYDDSNAVNATLNESELSATQCGEYVHFNMTCDVVEVYAITGELVFATNDVNQLSLSSLNAGVYVIRATSDSNTAVLKVVK